MSNLPAPLAQALAESLADGVVVCEAGGAIRWMNPAMCRLLGLALGEALPAHRDTLGLTLGKPWHIPNSLRNQSLFSLGERYVTLNETPVSDDDGGALSLLVLRDCTAQLAESWDSEGYLGTMFLLLGTPLTVIRGFSDLLLRESAPPLYTQGDLDVPRYHHDEPARQSRYERRVHTGFLRRAAGPTGQRLRAGSPDL
jgi:PAS domain-containing protein